ncbi:hypothetical protein Bca4012_050710 [Brassica carinata]
MCGGTDKDHSKMVKRLFVLNPDGTSQQRSKPDSNERREEEPEIGCPSHHPPPPPDELFDLDTTIDPSYVISLIRKLLPVDSGREEYEFVDAASKGYPENMDIGSNHNESTSEEKDKASSSVEEAWKEHGCVLWDLPTSETHADLMNQGICCIDLLNPPAELEKRKHKLKRLVQSPNSFLLPTVLGLRSLRLKRWADTSSSREEHPPNIDKRSLQDLLFFLHVPRTGGRTYFHCFLRTLYDNAEECPRFYDKLHFDPSY